MYGLTGGILLLLLLFPTQSLQAQVGEYRNVFSVGVGGGVNLNSVSFSPTVRQKNLMGMTAGLAARYISEKYFALLCGAQLEINFSQHGWSEFYEDFPHLSYTRTTNYVEIPFLAHIGMGNERGLQFFLHAGPQVGFFLNDSYTMSDNWDTVSGAVTEQHDQAVENKFDYGIVAGLGVELHTNIGNFLLEGRYYYGLSDFYHSTKKDYFARSANTAITVKATYLFNLKK
ncbi:MAG: PorT family protein [Prevotellaceae bacterium]|jgi:hypothetical protein|nr:PorT family protein [Prevotellaceae bacterium]